jgi:hypothetical protein
MRFMVGVFLTLVTAGFSANGQDISQTTPCDVTLPNEKSNPGQPSAGWYGNESLSVALAWPNGTVVFKPGGAGSVLPDGSLSMKFGWERRVRGSLVIDGRRLDSAAPPLRANVPCCYGDIGFQATALVFPTPGCWEVTGHVGTRNLTFVTKVVKIGDGPGIR